MDLAEIWRVMRRRWYVLIPGLVITAALAAAVHFLVPVQYQSQSTVTLLNSKKATEAFDGNPFLSTQTSLTGMADGLARNLNSDGAVADLKALGLTGTHEAKIADNALGPFMWLTVTGTDRAAVLKSDEILTAYAQKRLDEFQTQQSVRPEAMIRMATIVPPQEPEAQTKSRIQFIVMAGALGFVLSLVATFFVEARTRRGPGLHRPEPGEDKGDGPGEGGHGGEAGPAADDTRDPSDTLHMKVHQVHQPHGRRPGRTEVTGSGATGSVTDEHTAPAPPRWGARSASRPGGAWSTRS